MESVEIFCAWMACPNMLGKGGCNTRAEQACWHRERLCLCGYQVLLVAIDNISFS